MNLTLPATLVESIAQLSGGAMKTYMAIAMLKAVVKQYPTQEDIAAYMNASQRSVRTYLHELERSGHVIKRRIGPLCQHD